MSNWQKYENYRKQRNTDGTYTCIITVDNTDVEVSEEIYKDYAVGGRKMKYMEFDLKHDRLLKDADSKAVRDINGHTIALSEREVSLDKLISEGWDYPSNTPTPEDIVIEQIETRMLYHCLDRLNTDERELVNALFFEELTVREHAELTGKSKSSIDRQKTKILAKLKNILTA